MSSYSLGNRSGRDETLSVNDCRTVRVFVSSTFRDMKAERECLVKRIFPQLRKFCEERDVTWAEVDLRWGVADEDGDDILYTCLKEIDRCRPFFIGLLGEQYGHTPQQISKEALISMPWLQEYGGKSITHLEILHGVLREKTTSGYAFFYFRDPEFLKCLPSSIKRRDFEPATPEAAAALAGLKQQVREARDGGVCRLRENYSDAAELGQWILEDFTRVISTLFPGKLSADPLALHGRFATARRRVWIGREVESLRLSEAVEAARGALTIGARGVGQSALLANWAVAWRQTHPEALVVEHYVGADPDANTVEGCCRQLCLSLLEGRGERIPNPTAENEWVDLFIEQLALAGRDRRVLLVVDGADRLLGRASQFGAEWLPEELPDGVQIVASASEEAAPLAHRRKWLALQVSGLNDGDRSLFIQQFLTAYGKKLSLEQADRIIRFPATRYPFYLTLLLDELRQHGNYEDLNVRLSELLAASDVYQLCKLVITRCKDDYDSAFPGFAGKALGYLVTARLGLSDTEICELIGGLQARAAQRAWSMLQLSLESVLISRNGLISFSHLDALAATQELLAPTYEARRSLHRNLADYFLVQEASPRSASEILWHLQRLEAWDELGSWLSKPNEFLAAWKLSPEEVCKAWAGVEEHTSRRAAEACHSFPFSCRPAALSLLRRLGRWTDAVKLARMTVVEARSDDSTAGELDALLAIGEIQTDGRSLREAEEAFVLGEEFAIVKQDLRGQLRALRGHARVIRHYLTETPQNGLQSAELLRQLRVLRERASHIAVAMDDSTLQIEAKVIWLEDFVAKGVGQRELLVTGKVLQVLQINQYTRRGLFSEPKVTAADSFNDSLHDEVATLEAAVRELRLTRHRGLALRADMGLAHFQHSDVRISYALRALYQYAAMHEDLELMADVIGQWADNSEGEVRLARLVKQSGILQVTGNRPALVRNWWKQSELLWPGARQRSNALVLFQRAWRDRHLLSSRGERLRMLCHGLRLWTALDEKRLRSLLRISVVIVTPFWILGLWVLARKAASLVPYAPFITVLCYIILFPLAFGPAVMLISVIVNDIGIAAGRLRLLTVRVLRSWRAAGDDGKPGGTLKRRGKPVLGTAGDRTTSDCGEATQEKFIDESTMKLLAAVGAVIRVLMRPIRATNRIIRIGLRLRLDRPSARLAWFAIAGPCGAAITVVYWRWNEWSHGWLLPVGLFGQLLLFESTVGLIQSLVIRYRRTVTPLSFVGMLTLIRLRRRLFRRRRHLANTGGSLKEG